MKKTKIKSFFHLYLALGWGATAPPALPVTPSLRALQVLLALFGPDGKLFDSKSVFFDSKRAFLPRKCLFFASREPSLASNGPVLDQKRNLFDSNGPFPAPKGLFRLQKASFGSKRSLFVSDFFIYFEKALGFQINPFFCKNTLLGANMVIFFLS